MKPRVECCEKYIRKRKLCKDCPLVAGLSRKERRKWLKRRIKKLGKAS